VNLYLVRDDFKGAGVEGKLYLEKVYFCETEERPWLDNAPRISCIPCGVYRVVWKWSPHFQRNMPHLEDVPGREYIMIHPANFPAQLLGCIAVGSERGMDAVFHSGDTFRKLSAMLEPVLARGEQVWITISNKENTANGQA
jgi:hypothetical protein